MIMAKKSQWDLDQESITWIQFKSGLSQKTKNKLIGRIEKREAKMTGAELAGKKSRKKYFAKNLEDTWGI